MSTVPAVQELSFVPSNIDRAKVLRAFNIDASDPKAQAMLLACEKYGLDPLLKHAILIKGNLYVTRDGLLHVAHRSGRLDGIVVDDEGNDAQEWWAKVTVYVKGQTHGYSYRGRYPKSGQQKQYGPEMAVKVAEVMALRRAFGVTGLPTLEEQWDKSDALAAGDVPRPPVPQIEAGAGYAAETPPPAGEPSRISEAAAPSAVVAPGPARPEPERVTPDAVAIVDVESGGGPGPLSAASAEQRGKPKVPAPSGSQSSGGARGSAASAAPPDVDRTGGEGRSTGNGDSAAAAAASPTPSGASPTFDDLATACDTGPKKTAALRQARTIANEDHHAATLPSDFADIANHPKVLADLCKALGVQAGGAAYRKLTGPQNARMHAAFAKAGGDGARKAYLSRLTSGRTDTSSELYESELEELMVECTRLLDGSD